MTAIEMIALCWWFHQTREYPDPSLAYKTALTRLVRDGLLEGSEGHYTVTAKGTVFLMAVLKTSLPIQAWVMKP